MHRTTLRAYISEADVVQQLTLPNGIRRVIFQPEGSEVLLHVGWDTTKVSAGTEGTSSRGTPWDSGIHYRDTGPLFFRGDVRGAFVRIDILHTAGILDVGGQGLTP